LLRVQRDFRRVICANLISQTGDWMLRIGLAYHVYDLTGSTLASAGTLLSTFLPSILVSSVAGVYVDRWDRKKTMIVASLLLAVGLVPLLVVSRPGDVWIVYVVMAWEGIVERFWIPAEQALLPRLVDEPDLVTANALNGQTRQIARLVGSAVGGIVVATGGMTALVLADAATFLMSAVLVVATGVSGRVERPAADMPGQAVVDGVPLVAPARAVPRLESLRGEWSEGLRLAMSERVLRVVFLFTLLAMTGEGVMGTLFVPFVRDVLHGNGQDYGLIVSVQAIGGMAGGVVAASLGQRISLVAMFGYGCVAFGLIDLLMFLYPLVWVEVWPAAVCMILVGLPGAVLIAGPGW
jgi:Na+/melibiose symporter-like transporter